MTPFGARTVPPPATVTVACARTPAGTAGPPGEDTVGTDMVGGAAGVGAADGPTAQAVAVMAMSKPAASSTFRWRVVVVRVIRFPSSAEPEPYPGPGPNGGGPGAPSD